MNSEAIAAELTLSALLAAMPEAMRTPRVLYAWLPDPTPVSREQLRERLIAEAKPLVCVAVRLEHAVGVASWRLPASGLGPYWDAIQIETRIDTLYQGLSKTGDGLVSVRGPVGWAGSRAVTIEDMRLWNRIYKIIGASALLVEASEHERNRGFVAALEFVGPEPAGGSAVASSDDHPVV